MKRDLDLIRRILLHVESQDSGTETTRAGFQGIADDDTSADSVHYHVQLLHDAGLIVADELVPGQWWPERITWSGHEFLDLARDDARWRQAVDEIEAKTGSAPFEVVRDILARRMSERLSSPSRRTSIRKK